MMKRVVSGVMAGTMLLGLAGCGTPRTLEEPVDTGEGVVLADETNMLQVGIDDENYTERLEMMDVNIQDEAVALSELPALMNDMMPEHPGTAVQQNNRAIIDYSNMKDGYVMVQWKNSSTKKIKVLIQGPVTKDTWQYDLTPGVWATFPLSDGNGKYSVTVYEQTSGDRYATVLAAHITATLDDEFAPFLRPNQYVNYENMPGTAALSDQIIGQETDVLKAVGLVYDWVVQNLTYDKQKAQTVKSDYLPVLDDIIAAKKGICFDYASLMTAMLRQHGVPCKLVVGYAGKAYHAWVSVYTEDQGWIDGVIYFDGTAWQRMDPTFASSGKSSSAILKYIGDGSHYTAKYLY